MPSGADLCPKVAFAVNMRDWHIFKCIELPGGTNMNSLTFPVAAQVFSGGHSMIRRYYSIFISNLFQSVCYFFKYEGSVEKKKKSSPAIINLSRDQCW